MPSPTPVPRPGLWIGCALSILLATQARSAPIEMTISGRFDSNYFVGGPITPQTVTLPDGFSDPSTLAPIALVSEYVSASTAIAGFPPDRFQDGIIAIDQSHFSLRLMFRTPDDPIAPSIDLNGSITKTFAKANGAERFSASVSGLPQATIDQNGGSNPNIPQSLLKAFASASIQLTGSMSEGADGNTFNISLSFGPAETPEPASILVLGGGFLGAWLGRSLRHRRREDAQSTAVSPR